jgi:peptidoglycan/xylan/chitin deacetylase (PgdA/CDA1 family)
MGMGQMQHIPILAYHRLVDDVPVDDYYHNCLRRELFVEQMQALAEAGYRTIPLETAALLMRHRTPPGKVVALTFDDGYVDTFDVAAPILRELGFTATVFVVAGLVGRRSLWDVGKCCTAPLMDWEQIRQLVAWGFSIGSHTVTHPELSQLSPADARYEIEHSRHILEERLGQPIPIFCYPFGEWNETTYRLVRDAGYRAACNDTWRHEHRPFALARVDGRYLARLVGHVAPEVSAYDYLAAAAETAETAETAKPIEIAEPAESAESAESMIAGTLPPLLYTP